MTLSLESLAVLLSAEMPAGVARGFAVGGDACRSRSRLRLAPQSCGYTVKLLGLTAPSGTIRLLTQPREAFQKRL